MVFIFLYLYGYNAYGPRYCFCFSQKHGKTSETSLGNWYLLVSLSPLAAVIAVRDLKKYTLEFRYWTQMWTLQQYVCELKKNHRWAATNKILWYMLDQRRVLTEYDITHLWWNVVTDCYITRMWLLISQKFKPSVVEFITYGYLWCSHIVEQSVCDGVEIRLWLEILCPCVKTLCVVVVLDPSILSLGPTLCTIFLCIFNP